MIKHFVKRTVVAFIRLYLIQKVFLVQPQMPITKLIESYFPFKYTNLLVIMWWISSQADDLILFSFGAEDDVYPFLRFKIYNTI